ncbi:MAG: D-glycero-beta-D-manno-heptose 1-phosphate adenylyltransferase [Chloroflexota bacterium]|nr:D-glycero-beta-D-manno-heptose 1-phosphate adenylyltransferase [Chloroflexota bacterium]
MGKVLDEGEALEELRRRRERGERAVFTNGCFDLLHVGHVRYLRQARELADVLIVAVNTDDSVRELKGPERPVVPEDERAEVLAALEAVDYVVLFPDRTAERLVGVLKPELYVKGGDYTLDLRSLPEAGVVQRYGGEVRLMPVHPGRSSSALLSRLKGSGS